MARLSRWLRSRSGMGKKPYHARVYFNVFNRTEREGGGIIGLYINVWRDAEIGDKRQTLYLPFEEMMELYVVLDNALEGVDGIVDE